MSEGPFGFGRPLASGGTGIFGLGRPFSHPEHASRVEYIIDLDSAERAVRVHIVGPEEQEKILDKINRLEVEIQKLETKLQRTIIRSKRDDLASELDVLKTQLNELYDDFDEVADPSVSVNLSREEIESGIESIIDGLALPLGIERGARVLYQPSAVYVQIPISEVDIDKVHELTERIEDTELLLSETNYY